LHLAWNDRGTRQKRILYPGLLYQISFKSLGWRHYKAIALRWIAADQPPPPAADAPREQLRTGSRSKRSGIRMRYLSFSGTCGV